MGKPCWRRSQSTARSGPPEHDLSNCQSLVVTKPNLVRTSTRAMHCYVLGIPKIEISQLLIEKYVRLLSPSFPIFMKGRELLMLNKLLAVGSC